MSKKVLFITWDGPQTSYMEGLFMPIFHEITKQEPSIQFHIIQFSWASQEKCDVVRKAAHALGIIYNHLPIYKSPTASVGSLLTMFFGSSKIKKYINEHNIDIVMPRATFTAFMVNQIRNKDFKVIFDADGLQIEERVEFAGLKRSSLQYRWLKNIETKMLIDADAVITRSQKAIDIHVENIGDNYRGKFSVVTNGRDSSFFDIDKNIRTELRREMNFSEEETVFIYAGSLGSQYCWEEMIQIFSLYQKKRPSKFLVLTGDTAFIDRKVPVEFRNKITTLTVPFAEVPRFLNMADVAFALRKPTHSMKGVAPVKLGEYLLTGLPTIASGSIGDTGDILENFKECFVFDHKQTLSSQIHNIFNWLDGVQHANRKEIRMKAVAYFSLETAADKYRDVIKMTLGNL